jgi:hypothetical protein
VQRVSTTVVCVVGADDRLIEPLRHKANLAVYQPDASAPALERAVAAWERARHTHTAYFLHDADPLASVADAWARFFQGSGPVGELEVIIGETLARWRARSLELPDYYLLCSPEEWPDDRRHWYLGVLAGACAFRVVTAGGEPDLSSKLPIMPAGQWWPDLDRLLAGVERLPPDQAGLPRQGSSSAGEADEPRLVAASRGLNAPAG